MTIHLVEHSSTDYPPRTRWNAERADLTIAFTVDSTTPGERLTKRLAGSKYLHIDLNTTTPAIAASLIGTFAIINIAGNDISTLIKHGWTQQRVNQFLYDIFKQCPAPTRGFLSGGQTGVDIAAAVIAQRLGLNALITFPNGYKQRNQSGIDFTNTETAIREQITSMANDL